MVRAANVVININGKDKSKKIMEHLESLTIVDNANNESDTFTLSINGRFKRPKYNDVIKVYLGFDDELNFFGLFRVEKSTKTFKGLTISATGINFGESFKVQRNITYERVSIKEIVNQVSNRHQLKNKSDFDDIYITSQAQTNESDMHFLNRIAKEYNAIFNIKNDTLYFMKKIKENKKNNNLPKYNIDLNSCGDSPTIEHSTKTFYNSCEVSWHSTKDNKTFKKIVPLGGGDPILKYKGSFKNEAEAIVKATAKLERVNQGIIKGSLSTEGIKIYAGGILTLKNSLDDDNIEYQITKVSHSFNNNGWITSVDFEKLKKENNV